MCSYKLYDMPDYNASQRQVLSALLNGLVELGILQGNSNGLGQSDQ